MLKGKADLEKGEAGKQDFSFELQSHNLSTLQCPNYKMGLN